MKVLSRMKGKIVILIEDQLYNLSFTSLSDLLCKPVVAVYSSHSLLHLCFCCVCT